MTRMQMKTHASDDEESPAAVETRDRARQAVTGHGVRYVLVFGLLGVLVAFAVLLIAFVG